MFLRTSRIAALVLAGFSTGALAANPAAIGNVTPQSEDMLGAPLPPAGYAALGAVCGRTMQLLRASPEFAACVSSLSWSAMEPGARLPAVPAGPDAEAKPWPLTASYGQRARNEAAACAALGLKPRSESLDICAADLEQAMFNTDNPQG